MKQENHRLYLELEHAWDNVHTLEASKAAAEVVWENIGGRN
jgi:hypothetical protein